MRCKPYIDEVCHIKFMNGSRYEVLKHESVVFAQVGLIIVDSKSGRSTVYPYIHVSCISYKT